MLEGRGSCLDLGEDEVRRFQDPGEGVGMVCVTMGCAGLGGMSPLER